MKLYLRIGKTKEILWDDAELSTVPEHHVYEGSRYGFCIEDPPEEAESFKLQIGDEIETVMSALYGGYADIADGLYFESAAGKTELAVMGFDSAGQELFKIPSLFYVVPSKLGEENYHRMVNDLNVICQALLSDLLGKSRHGKIWERFRRHSFRSHEEELIAIQRMWKSFSISLRMITDAPQGYLSRQDVVILPHGKNAANHRTQRKMLQRGAGSPARLIRQQVSKLEYSLDTPEHRLLKRFIKILQLRVSACLKGIDFSIGELEKNGQFRKQAPDDQVSLYESEDIPRIGILENRRRDARDLLNSLEQQLCAPFWNDVSEALFLPGPEHFIANRYYKHAAHCIFQFLQNGFYWEDSSSSDFTTKKSSRMYEQWVLINLVNAFRAFGISFAQWDDVIGKALESQFNIDFERGAQFLSMLSPHSRYLLSIRYEPWIIPNRDRKTFPDATLYHAERIPTYWSPDIVLELQKETDTHRETIYAIAIDCKYSRSIGEEQSENTRKYLKIRSSDSGKQVVGQLWLFYLGKDEQNSIIPEDSALCFRREIGICPADTDCIFEVNIEKVEGRVIAKPYQESGESSDSTGNPAPPPVFLDFAEGTLAFLRKYFPEEK